MHYKLWSVTYKSLFPQQFVSADSAMRRAIVCGLGQEEFLVMGVSGNAHKDYEERLMFCVRSNKQQ